MRSLFLRAYPGNPQAPPRGNRAPGVTERPSAAAAVPNSGPSQPPASAGSLGREGRRPGSFERSLNSLLTREDRFFLFLSVVIGVLSGLMVVCFRIAIDHTRLWLFGSAAAPSPMRVILVPTLAGLLLAFLVLRVFPKVRGSGVTHTKSALYIYNGYIPFETVIGKFLTCALSIGSGQSLGPEDPSLQIGAGIASALGRRLRLSRDKLRLIAPVGAAAGLAAAFNAPLSAVVFVIEEVIGTWSTGILGAVVLAAVSSVVISRLFLGSQPMFQTPVYRMAHPAELLTYAVLGVAGGLLSVVFAKLLIFVRGRARKLPRWTLFLQPAAAGLAIGIIGLRFPQVMGAGYDSMDMAMRGQFVWKILLALALLKIVATSFSAASGAPGGMFAPTLFVGAMLGAGVGTLQQHFFPAYTGPLGSYALVGMGTLFAGFLRVPITSVFMTIEVSGNYSIILPVLVSNLIAYGIARRFQETPIFDAITRSEGLELPSMEENREHKALAVEIAMRKPECMVLRGGDTVRQAWERIAEVPDDPLLVSYDNGRWALASRKALQDADKAGNGDSRLSDVLPVERLPRLHSDQTLDLALRLLRDAPFLPVVHRADARMLVGLLSLDDILAAYRRVSAPEFNPD